MQMLLLVCAIAFLAFAAVVLYLLLGRNRYGGDRPSNNLQLTASAAAMRQGSLKPETVRILRIYFIKPSKYDDDGYVSLLRDRGQPNTTLTVLAALNEEFNRKFSGSRNVHLETIIWDEICDGVVSLETIKAIKDKAREDGV